MNQTQEEITHLRKLVRQGRNHTFRTCLIAFMLSLQFIQLHHECLDLFLNHVLRQLVLPLLLHQVLILLRDLLLPPVNLLGRRL